jgi:hypothetical protein
MFLGSAIEPERHRSAVVPHTCSSLPLKGHVLGNPTLRTTSGINKYAASVIGLPIGDYPFSRQSQGRLPEVAEPQVRTTLEGGRDGHDRRVMGPLTDDADTARHRHLDYRQKPQVRVRERRTDALMRLALCRP